MRILFLGYPDSGLIPWLRQRGEDVFVREEKLTPADFQNAEFDFLVSYGYRHILKKDVLDRFPSRAINLHVSFLPWNRGADPNAWSFLEDTPKGVTIHHIDEGVDTGDIIVQQLVDLPEHETLAQTYGRLQDSIQALFRENWDQIRAGRAKRLPQPAGGSVHKRSDRSRFEKLLTAGWDTPVSQLVNRLPRS